MTVVLWVLAGLLAAFYLAVGVEKLARSTQALARDPRHAWVTDVAPWQVKVLGAVEVLAALGLVLPQATGIAERLTPTAAICIELVQIGAMAMHIRRDEFRQLLLDGVLFVLALVVALGRLS